MKATCIPELSGFDNLCFCASQRKRTIAAGIIHEPRILFLDEPTTGIDLASARQLRKIICELHAGETTIFFTTHYIEEAERLCDRIAFIVSGRVVRVDTVESLLQPVQGTHILMVECADTSDGTRDALRESFPGLEFETRGPGTIRVQAAEPIRVGPLARFLEERGVEVTEARRVRPSLEDVFARVTGLEAETMRKEKGRKGGGQ